MWSANTGRTGWCRSSPSVRWRPDQEIIHISHLLDDGQLIGQLFLQRPVVLRPVRYQLLFERFLNPERVSMPDIDIDFCFERRQEVIDYGFWLMTTPAACMDVCRGSPSRRLDMSTSSFTCSQAAEAVRARTGAKPELGLILGSGLGDFCDRLENQTVDQDRDGNLLLGVALVVVDPTLHDDHGNALDPSEDEPALVPRHRGIQKFLDEGLISKEGTRIIVDRAQHQASAYIHFSNWGLGSLTRVQSVTARRVVI